MERRSLQLIGRWSIAGLILLGPVTGAYANGMDATLSGVVSSRYMWNSFDRLEARGLEAGPVFQPRLTIGVLQSPLQAHVGGSFLLEKDAEMHEVVYGVSVERSVSLLARFGLGYNYYDDQLDASAVTAPGPGAVIAGDGHEVWASLSASSPTGVEPTLELRWQDPKADGAEAYYVASAGLVFGFPVVPAAGVAGVGVDLNWNTHVTYNTGVKVNGVDVVERGVSAWTVGLAASVQAARVTVSPYVSYQVTLEPTVLDENPFWAGVGMSYTF